MTSELHEDIVRLYNSIMPKIAETMREIRALDIEVETVKKIIQEKDEIFFSTITKLSRFDRIEGAFEIEKLHKKVLEISRKKVETVQQTRHLLGKYVIKVNEKLALFREKMDEDYPGTAQNIEKKVTSQMLALRQMFYNLEDAVELDKKKNESISLLTKNSSNAFDWNDEFTPCNEIIPSFNNAANVAGTALGTTPNSHSNVPSSQPPPLTALKQNRGKNIANKSLKATSTTKSSTKTKTDTKQSESSSSNAGQSSALTNVINSGHISSNTSVKSTPVTPNKNPRKRKNVDNDEELNKSVDVDIAKMPALSNQNKTDTNSNVLTTGSNEDTTQNESNADIKFNLETSVIVPIKANDSAEHQQPNEPLNEKGVNSAKNSCSQEDPAKGDQDVFCFCKQPSYGEMIGCDSDNCNIGWFHLECVGLLAAPEGEWYCSNCTVSRETISASEPPHVSSDVAHDTDALSTTDDTTIELPQNSGETIN